MVRSLSNRIRRQFSRLSKRSQLQRSLRVESLERRQFLAADPVPTLVNYLTTEHTDLNIGYSGGGWSLGPRADVDPTTQFKNDEVVLYVGEPASAKRPGAADYDFIGVPAGEDFYLLPQTQNQDALYLGFSSYDVSGVDSYNASAESKGRTGTSSQRWIKASLIDVNHWNPDGTEGDGDFSLWQNESFGAPIFFMSSYDDGIQNPDADGIDQTDGISVDDALWIPQGAHRHYNFGFTDPGRYEVDIAVSGFVGGEQSVSPPIRLYFSVSSAGELQFENSSYSVDEGAGTASIDVVRVGGSDGRLEVNYATSDATATAGSDYTVTSGSLVFADGETRKTITVPILEDTLVEGDETMDLTLSVTAFNSSRPSPDYKLLHEYVKYRGLGELEDINGLLGDIDLSVLTIVDNDVPPTISDVSDQTTAEDTPVTTSFVVGDTTTAADALVVTATSSNPTLVPDGNIVLGGSGANRTVTITPAANLYGVTTITLTVEDEDGLTAADTFDLTVTSVNDLPTITDVSNQSMVQDTSTDAIPFAVGDVETAAAALTVTATSSDPSLVPNESIMIGGSGANRTVTVTPTTGQMGNATITLTVTDGDGGTTSDTFVLNVGPPNTPPTISDIADQTTEADVMIGAIAFTVSDAITAAEALVVTVTSSNLALVPDSNIALGGSGANRTIAITPAAGRIGSTTITVTVTDEGGLQASDTFDVVVTGKSVVPFGLPEVVGAGLDYVFEPELADIDGDGHIDILTASLGADSVVWFKNLGDGTYGPEQVVSDEAGLPWEAHLADLDADGDKDVIVGGYNGDLVWHENRGESFGPAQSIDEGLYGPFIRSADVDGDGKLDVLVARDMGEDIYWYRNEGDGEFGSSNVIATGLNAAAGFVVRDLNGDGLPEAITGESGAGQIAFFVNNGDGTFGAKQTVASTEGAIVYASDDLNGDGIDDLLVVGLDSLEIGFHAGQSDGTVGPFTALPSVSKPFAATSADFDQDGDFDVLIGSYGGSVVWLQNFGGGNFSDPIEITRDVGQVNGIATADIDGDGDPDVVAADLAHGEIVVIPNRLGEFATTIQPPATRTYPAGQNLDLSIHLGIPVTVTGTPSVSLQVGDQTVETTYVSGSGTTELLFRYTVVEPDSDDDGIELVDSSIHLNGGTIIGPFGDPVDLTLPAVDLSGVLVNGSAPFVHGIERSSLVNPTAAGEVTFQVTFSEAVTGVDADDFGLTLDDVTGAIVTGVSGSGQEYWVTVSTGTGSGTIGLEVMETATAEDAEGNPLVEGFVGGEVFTVNRRPARDITNFFTAGHGDIRVGYDAGIWDLDINPDALEGPFAADEVLIVGGSDSQVTAPSDSAFDFLGAAAGSDIYILPQSSVPPTIPDLGLSASGIATGEFASDAGNDPRVDGTAAWVEWQLVDMRGPNDGQFSVYSSELDGPIVWVATSDGITDQDSIIIQTGSHNHLNWAFTKPGIYEVDVFASGFLDRNDNGAFDEGVDRYTESGIVTYYFSIDPAEGPQPYTIAADAVPANELVPFALPEYHGGAYSAGTWGQVTGDFNNDGNVDLIIAGTVNNSLTFMAGNGDGTFQPEQVLNPGSDVRSEGLVTVDYDGDGDEDLLAYEYNQATLDGTADEGTITLYRNDGSANFSREVLLGGLIQGYWIDAGDLNGDGLVDVAYGSYRYISSTRIFLAEKASILQQADGTLGDKTVLTDEYYGELLIEDIDGDGASDIVSTGSVFDSSTFTSTPYLQVFWGNGDGTFSSPLDVSSIANPEIHQIVDLDGDGRKDLLAYNNSGSNSIGFYPQQADGSFADRVVIMPGYRFAQRIIATDMNLDDILDVVSYSYIDGGYQLNWAPGLGGGQFGDAILVTQNPTNGGLHVADVDNDSYPDIINAGGVSTVRPAPISVFLNKTGEDPMVLLPPAARTRIGGDPIDLQIYFGFPIDVTGTPRIALQLGDNTVYADYVSGSGTPFLDFRYTVADTDIDLDGVQLASNVIDLNGGTLTDPIGGEAVLEFPNLPFEGVFVNAVGPLVSGITRQDTTPTDVDSVRFEVKFAEDVTGVDAADFDVVMNAGDLSGATIDSVVGSGTTYTVTILTGTGSGTLALSVKDDASITNTGGHPLARGYFGGEVYTLRRGTADPIEYYYTDQHSDYRPVWNDGEMILAVHGSADVIPGGEIASNRIYTYADSNALVERSEDAAYDFVGVSAGESLYVLPSSQLPGVPYLGFTNGDVPTDLFASYVPDDPFITSSTPRPYIRYEMTDMRSSSGGEFSMWSTPSSGPRVYMTTSDGISSDDILWSSGHLHRTLGFSKPGIYEVDVFLSGYLDVNANGAYDEGFDPYYESGIQTMVFNVDTLGAVDDSFTVIEGETLNGDVSLNDDWHESMGDYTASVETEPANGTLTLNADGSFAYEPNEGFTGTDHFTYLVTNQRGGFTSASVTLVAPSINVQLVPVALPSDPSVTDLPDGIDSVPVGSSYFVEVWVQDKNDQLDGIAGGHIDIQYTTDLLDALNLNHQNFNELQSGVIHEAAGLIDDFGGGTLTQGQSLAPQWARLGYVEVIATSAGDAEYRLLPGALPFARFGGGNVGFDDVNLSDIATVTHTESWRLDLTVVRDPSDTLDDGSVDQIPASVSYVHEWEPFYVEVYLSNVTDVDGVETITFDLSYDTSITTALQFKPGPSFEFPDGLPVVDDIAGTVSNIELIATKLGLGTEPVLLGHILFRPTDSDDVAMDQAGEQTLGPHTLGLAASAVTEVAGQQVNVMMGETPATAMWAVPYDVDDSDQIDFADFAIFAAVFGASVENSETPFTSWADFDGSGLIDFDDLAFFDANQGLTVDDDKLLSFSSVYPTPELALPQAITPPELTQATLQMFSSFGPFNNGSDAYDVNNSGGTSPLDALLIINALNSQTNAQPYFLDVNGDGRTTPLDALWVINRLDRTSPEQASATDEALSTSSVSTQPFWSENNKDSEGEDLIALLAADQRLF